jgi:hypothetical protein
MSQLQDGNTRLVLVQISCSNAEAVPSRLKHLPRNSSKKLDQGRQVNGVQVIAPTMNCDTLPFLDQLVREGYQLVDASYQTPIDKKDPNKKRRYHKLSFTFAPAQFVDISNEFRAVRESIMDDLEEMCDAAMWRVRAYSNPFLENGVPVEGQQALSVNLEARVPLFQADGNPVKRWMRDAEGKKIGTEPVDLTPDFGLVF